MTSAAMGRVNIHKEHILICRTLGLSGPAQKKVFHLQIKAIQGRAADLGAGKTTTAN